MTVAIVHYHLGLGGVSSVITATSRCLTELEIPHVILVDTPPGPEFEGIPVRQVPGLGYPSNGEPVTASELQKKLRAMASDMLGGAPDVWHFHNHSIGKNPLMAEVVAQLAESKQKLVLQIHDLAEDGRQQNYASIPDVKRLYPMSSNVRYVFLNERDRKVFIENGLDQKQASLIVNPVPVPEENEKINVEPSADAILFAPVRAIRRKNIGELVFLSALAPAGTRVAVSRAPNEPRALMIHETWRKFASHQRLPIGFDVVENYSPSSGQPSGFDSWVKHCTHFITTSVSEGFGLTFLEAAAHGKPLIGRNIERIANEHSRHGIQAGNLYDQLLIPIDWVDISILRGHFDTCIERNFRYLGRALTKPIIEDTFAELIKDGWLDFGNLPEPLQQGAVERLNDPGTKSIPRVIIGKEDKPAREWLFEVLKNRKPTVTPKQLSPYSTKEYSKAIKAIYEDLASQPLEDLNFLDPSPILDAHLEPKNFHFLCSVIPPRPASWSQYRAVIFDIYGTLLIAPAGGVQPSSALDGLLRNVLVRHGFSPPESPSQALYDAVKRHHAEAKVPYPEVDLRVLWREILSLNSRADVTNLVVALESECRPSQPMLGAAAFIRRLAHSGVSLGLLSNGQCNTLRSLGGIRDFFAPELTILSYQHGIAKPAPELFQLLKDRLACQNIPPSEALFIGNDPVQDIIPAAAFGFRTALFTGHPDSFRPGNCTPDHEISEWPATGVGSR